MVVIGPSATNFFGNIPLANSTHADIARALSMNFQGIRDLRVAFPHRAFTVDGHLVGDVGEIIVQLEYGLELDQRSLPTHDATTADGMRRVSVKATFKDSLTFTKIPDYMIRGIVNGRVTTAAVGQERSSATMSQSGQ